MKLKEGVDTKKLKEKVLNDFTKLMAIGLVKVSTNNYQTYRKKERKEMRQQYDSDLRRSKKILRSMKLIPFQSCQDYLKSEDEINNRINA